MPKLDIRNIDIDELPMPRKQKIKRRKNTEETAHIKVKKQK